MTNSVHPERQDRIRGPLKFFQIAATITGLFLIALVIRMILQYIVGMDIPDWATIIAQAHGIAYMVYLLSILILGPRALWPVGKLFTTALAGVVPFFSFYLERKRSAEVKEQFQLA
ncbi:DUF3817 domain-containing protein [Corynebacterium camporealensis]